MIPEISSCVCRLISATRAFVRACWACQTGFHRSPRTILASTAWATGSAEGEAI